jgi:DNA/RNA-binding domain of Phe-tRNA-synthetase-like protein
VEEEIFRDFPEARLGIVLCDETRNEESSPAVRALLREAEAEGLRRLDGREWLAVPEIACWRAAYRSFGAAKDRRSSVEALLRRVRGGKELPSLSPLVDLYNAVSLRHLLPAGGEDREALRGDLRLARAVGGEPFLPLGAEAEDPPLPGEIAYLDGEGAVCRCWNWREATRTRLRPETRRAVLVIESLLPDGGAALRAATEELARLVLEYAGGRTRSFILDRDHPEGPLSPDPA